MIIPYTDRPVHLSPPGIYARGIIKRKLRNNRRRNNRNRFPGIGMNSCFGNFCKITVIRISESRRYFPSISDMYFILYVSKNTFPFHA